MVQFVWLLMNKGKAKKVDRDKLSWIYKLILKIPGTDFLESAGRIFSGIIIPVFGTLEFFLSLFLLFSFPFQTNIFLAGIIPITLLIVFIRINLERFLNWWDSAFGESRFEWDVEKTMQEYITLLEKKEEKSE